MSQDFEPTPRPTHSPWGGVQSAKEYAPGIWSVCTPSHGGFSLSPERNTKVADCWRSDTGWYEEDCEWAIVCATWPEFFTEVWRLQADVTLRNWHPDGYEATHGVTLTAANSHAVAEREFWERHIEDFVVRSAWGDHMAWVPEGFVGVIAGIGRRPVCGSPREERYFLVPASEYRLGSHGFVIDRARHAEIPAPTNPHERRQRAA